jgi:HPt (histidine-containing phosphotransfer) domain-containing protein
VDLIQALRKQAGGSTARIVAISGSEPGEAIRETADGFLLKPIQAEDLVRLLATDAPEGELANVAAEAVPHDAIDQNIDPVIEPVIDQAVLGKLKAMMPAKAVEEIYSAVASDLATRLATLKAAMDAADVTEVKRIAHAIKGGCVMVGLSGAGQVASRLETSNSREAWPKELLQLQLALNHLQGILGDGLPW